MPARLIRFARRCFVVACLFAIAAVHPSPALAQFGMDGGMGMDQTKLTRRGLDLYARILKLDADQKEVANSLLEGNLAAHGEITTQFTDAMRAIGEKVQETQDFSLYRTEMPRVAKDFADKAEKLENSFFEDLKGILTDPQRDRWASVERARRREKGLRFGFASGQAVDLIAVAERTRIRADGASEIDAILEQYEVEVDRPIQALEKAGKDAQKQALEGDGAAMFDPAKMQDMMKSFYDDAKVIRDMNRDYTRRIAAILNDDARARFQSEVDRRSFYRIYKAGHTQKMLEAAAGYSDLTAEQKDTIVAMKESYLRDLAAANERWAKAQEEREDAVGGTIMVMMQGIMGAPAGAEAVNKARDDRRELDQKTADRLKEVLSDDQEARLPSKPKPSGNPWQDFMFDPDAEESTEVVK